MITIWRLCCRWLWPRQARRMERCRLLKICSGDHCQSSALDHCQCPGQANFHHQINWWFAVTLTTKSHRCSSPDILMAKVWSFPQFQLLCLHLRQLTGLDSFQIEKSRYFLQIQDTSISDTNQFLPSLVILAIPSYHLLGFERHAANFLLANLQPTSVLKVAYSFLVFLALVVIVVLFWTLLLGLGFCVPSFLLVQQEGLDGIQRT